ncbi:MAG: extracellular solute-binding protein [Spirochaetes bacterium]|nr:extracellular solute-binding protein [Spirochaetota bacterium]
MQKAIKILVLTILSLFIVMPLSAGGQKEAKEEGPVKLSFWHLWGGSRTPLIKKLINDFKADHPNVEFEVTFTPPNELQKKVVQAAGTGTLPDVFGMHTGWYVNLLPGSTLLELDSYLSKDSINLKKILVAADAERSYYEGHVYSLPNVCAGAQGLFFYNKGLMRKAGLDPDKDAPKNWDDFVKISKILVEKLNTPGKLDVIAWDPNQMAGQPALIVFSYGAGYPTVSDNGKTSQLDTPGVLATAEKFDQYIKDIYGSYGGYRGILEWNSRVAGADTGAAQVKAFIKEKQVFYVSGSWTIGQVKSGNPDLDLGIIPVPGFKGQQGGIAKNGWSYAISKNSKHKDMAWEFLKFITIDPAGNGEFCKAQRRPSPIAAVNDDPVYAAMGDMWTNLVAAMNMDIVPVAPDINQDILKPWLRDIPARRIAGESIDAIMKDISKQYQGYLNDIYQ